MRYYRVAGIQISEKTLEEFSLLLDRLIRNYSDHMAGQIVKKFLDYCAQLDREPVAVRNLRAFFQNSGAPGQWFDEMFDSDELDD